MRIITTNDYVTAKLLDKHFESVQYFQLDCEDHFTHNFVYDEEVHHTEKFMKVLKRLDIQPLFINQAEADCYAKEIFI